MDRKRARLLRVCVHIVLFVGKNLGSKFVYPSGISYKARVHRRSSLTTRYRHTNERDPISAMLLATMGGNDELEQRDGQKQAQLLQARVRLL